MQTLNNQNGIENSSNQQDCEFTYAGFLPRLFAYIIDIIVIGIASFFIKNIVLGGLGSVSLFSTPIIFKYTFADIFSYLLKVLYFSFCVPVILQKYVFSDIIRQKIFFFVKSSETEWKYCISIVHCSILKNSVTDEIHESYATYGNSEKSGMTSIMVQKKMMLFEVSKVVWPFLLCLVRFSQQVLQFRNSHCKRVTLAGMSRRKSENVSLANWLKCFLND